jgi:hypothetical protein
MRAHIYGTVRIALAAITLAAAPAAHSQMYRWTDAQGSVTYSNQPPTDKAGITDLSVIPDIPNTVSTPEKRTGEAAGSEQQRPASAGKAAPPESPRTATRDALEEFNRSATTGSATGTDGPPTAAPAPRISISPTAPEAVRDPCLRSGNPKCYDRNPAAYVPYRGYSPSAASIGATGVSAGGTLAGGSPAPGPGKITAPKSSTYALPPGSEPIPATPTKR